MLRNGRWRTLIIAELVVLMTLCATIVALFIYTITAAGIGISWLSVGIAGSAVTGEIVRRIRHLRTDIANYHDDGTERK